MTSTVNEQIESDTSREKPDLPNGDSRKKRVGGVRAFTLTIAFLVISVALCIGVGYETLSLSERYETLEQTNDFAKLCEKAISQAGKTSDYLAAESRLFATTGDITHALNYFEESEQNKNREHSLETIRENYDDPEVVRLLEDAMQKSNDLMSTEEYSMVLMLEAQGLVPGDIIPELANITLSAQDAALAPDKKRELAAEILFNQAYAHDKGAIDSEVAEVLDRVTASTDQIHADESENLKISIFLQQLLITLLIIGTIASSLATIFFMVLPLRDDARRLEKDERLEVKGAYELRYVAQTYNDIYDFKLGNENLLRERARRDSLTGVLNHGAFDKEFEELQHSGKHVCLAVIDIDNFKQVNDTYGHSMGDRVLCIVGELLNSRFRSTDVVARIGGDEFAVIAVDLPFADAYIMKTKMESISERLANPRGDICPVTLSVGCAFSDGTYNPDLFNQADSALYSVKESGRNGFAIFGGSVTEP